jgi:microcompartment protein CcmL/EutN
VSSTAPDGPALGLIELCSVARGVFTCDAMVKKAHVRLVDAGSTHPGKYSILIGGGVDEVAEAMAAGASAAADALIDQLFLPFPHADLVTVLAGPQDPPLESIAVLETFSIAATIRGADAALKAAQVQAVSIKLARDLGGKGFFVLTGLLHDVEEAVRAGKAAIGPGLLAGCEIVANPHPDVANALK